PPKTVKGTKPWAKCRRLPSYDSVVKTTLFGQHYLATVVDEAHAFRNVGAKHIAALEVLGQSVLRLIMTATPLQTSTKDLAAMGRLVGLPHFFSDKALAEEKSDMASIRKAKMTLSDDADDEEAVKLCCAEISARMHNQFQDRNICRGPSSLDSQGKPLIVLPPCHTRIIELQLADWEQTIMDQLAIRATESASTSNSVSRVTTQNFYIELRMGGGYARYNTHDAIPKFKTMDEWVAKKSTKMDACAKICQHILSRDDAPEVITEDGCLVFPPTPPLPPGQQPEQEAKILIYQEFSSLGPVLDLYGIKYLYIDGDTTFEQRAAIVEQFRTDPIYRVLIFSNVGSVGLNLSRA
ncbi:hypothetical protein BDN72DRAFT_720003, partial [Pluteus cervinus]